MEPAARRAPVCACPHPLAVRLQTVAPPGCMLIVMARTAGNPSWCSRHMPFNSTQRSYRLSRRLVHTSTRPPQSARTLVCQLGAVRALRVCTLVRR